ncbi:MAG: cellulase family glycosylhydrolase, partial [Myxococcota bacterium]
MTGLKSWKLMTASALFVTLLAACGDSGRHPDTTPTQAYVQPQRQYIFDQKGRYINVHGINVGGTNKYPVNPPVEKDPRYPDPRLGNTVSFTGRPFPITEADHWFGVIRSLGFNTIRLVITWEAIEHEGFRNYDVEFLDYIDQLVGKAEKQGIYVLFNFHENLFSRYLYVWFNSNPSYGAPGSVENMLAMVLPDEKKMIAGKKDPWELYDSRISGDGAPRWVVESILREKNLDAPTWGMWKIMGHLNDPAWQTMLINSINEIIKLFGNDEATGQAFLPDKPGAAAFASKSASLRKSGAAVPRNNAARVSAGGFTPPERTRGSGGEVGAAVPRNNDEPLEEWLQKMVVLMSGVRPDPKNPDRSIVPFDITETADAFPTTAWFESNNILSWDIERCYAAFYAGDSIFPGRKFVLDGSEVSIKEYLQEAYAGSWAKLAEIGARHDNVIGYDLVNEPPGLFIILAVVSGYFAADFDTQIAQDILEKLVGEDLATSLLRTLFMLNVLPVFPTRDFWDELYIEMYPEKYKAFCGDTPTPECRAQFLIYYRTEIDRLVADNKAKLKANYAVADVNAMNSLMLNFNFSERLIELYELVGQRILMHDGDAIIWLEGAGGAGDVLGGLLGINLWRPRGIPQIVNSPHWYPDIYPYLGIGSAPRVFNLDEWLVRDFSPSILSGLSNISDSFGPIPQVYGEFGTYFNYAGIETERQSGYRISSQILNNYYEAFEKYFTGRMLWDFTVNNSYKNGDQWNKEDFSVLGPKNGYGPVDEQNRLQYVLGPDGQARYPIRGALGFERPTPLVLSGKPVETHFYGPYHYFDPKKGQMNPVGEFH